MLVIDADSIRRNTIMKVCQNCGIEIGTKDGDNYCVKCDDADTHRRAQLRRNAYRRLRDQTMRDMGLVKVRGALGGTYWE